MDGTPNRYLANIRAMSGAARQHLILLLAGREMPRELFTTLCREIENLFFAYVIARESSREFERKFAQWAKDVRTVETKAELQHFLDEHFRPEKEHLAPRFELAVQHLREDSLQKYRLRYVLAKLTQHVNESAWGSETEGDLDTFLDASVHIEHVLPQTPTQMVLAEFDKPDEVEDYVGRLGNLTLAEEAINVSLGNKPFTEKQPVYTNSKFILTRLLSGHVKVGKNTAVEKAVAGLPTFSSWSSKTIEERQVAIAILAQKVWDIPRSKEGSGVK